jgi:hypothetical protein
MRKTELSDTDLCIAVHEMSRGLIDADLGGGLLKKRIGLAGRGKRAGARTLVATNKSDRWFYLYGFEKNERSNVNAEEIHALQWLAEDLLDRTTTELDRQVALGILQEICDDRKDQG